MVLHTRRQAEHQPSIEQLESAANDSTPTHVRAPTAAARAAGAVAVGALAIGALAVGALAIGRLVIGRARIRRLEIDELVVRKLRVIDLLETPISPRADSDNTS